jgi:hypothetical protein
VLGALIGAERRYRQRGGELRTHYWRFGIAAHIDQVDASSIAFSGEGPIVDRGSNIGTLFAEGAIDRVIPNLSKGDSLGIPKSPAT